MPIRSNLHTHSQFSDGKAAAEEFVLLAIQKGFVSLGFSEHGYAPYDPECCIKKANIPLYLAEMVRLKNKYSGVIELYTGFESDYFCPADKLDFSIGSVHYLKDEETEKYYAVDYRPQLFEQALHHVAGGDIRALVQLYYSQVADMAEQYRPDILGHLDLITRLNGQGRYFDPDSGWYNGIVAQTTERIAKTGCIVEVNTGGIYRGGLSQPYPSASILAQLRELAVPVTISSDAHEPAGLDFYFAEAATLLKKTGYTAVKQLQGGKFVDVEL